jgi:hydroxymethylglutaryl-CoA reductase (NADPH)
MKTTQIRYRELSSSKARWAPDEEEQRRITNSNFPNNHLKREINRLTELTNDDVGEINIHQSRPNESQEVSDHQHNKLDELQNTIGLTLNYLRASQIYKNSTLLNGNIENFIGMSAVPTGVVGPLKVSGSAANGSYYVPLATTEGALVASYNRGAKACTIAGGVTSICTTEGVQRCPLFKFNDIAELGRFIEWVFKNGDIFNDIVSKKSNYAILQDINARIEGNHLILIFEYYTGDASGQNMVTICTQSICDYIISNCPVKPKAWFIESNYSGDKKASSVSFSNVRGKKVCAEIELPTEVVREILKSTPEAMAKYCQYSSLAMIQSGAIGAQGHLANGLASLFIATGQDVACVSEAAVGITRLEVTEAGDLYIAVTLPNLIVGTVGGGTYFPTQQECLAIMQCEGKGTSRKYAEICGALLLAGELSIVAAMSAGHFTRAHEKLGRKNNLNSKL